MNDYFRALRNIKPGGCLHHTINGECIEHQILEKAAKKATKYDEIKFKLGGFINDHLEIVFKALEEDIIDIEGSRVSVCLEYSQARREWFLTGRFCHTSYRVKDYKKTWWLRGEKDE